MSRIVLLSLICLLAGCQSVSNRGEFVENEKIAALEKAHVDKEKVLEVLGEPTIVSDYAPYSWYYISRKAQDKVFGKPKVISQRIVKISFENDRVSKVSVDDKLPTQVQISKDHTPTKGTEQSVVQTFVKNFGRFNKSGHKKRR